MSKRTLKEQEYQLLAMKYRAEKWLNGVVLELLANGVITYLLLQWNVYVAALYGSWGILSVWKVAKKYRNALREHANFKLSYNTMASMDPNSFVSKLNRAVERGEEELARMEKEMEDDDAQH